MYKFHMFNSRLAWCHLCTKSYVNEEKCKHRLPQRFPCICTKQEIVPYVHCIFFHFQSAHQHRRTCPFDSGQRWHSFSEPNKDTAFCLVIKLSRTKREQLRCGSRWSFNLLILPISHSNVFNSNVIPKPLGVKPNIVIHTAFAVCVTGKE